MRGRIVGLGAVLVLCAVAGAHGGHRIVPKTTVVHVDERVPSTLQSFLAAVPTALFHQGDDAFQSVLLADRPEMKPYVCLLEDWKKYLGDAPSKLLFVGDVSSLHQSLLTTGLGVAAPDLLAGDTVQSLAQGLAAKHWKSAGTVVVAPGALTTRPTMLEMENLANAAVMAAMLDCPLLYTEASDLGEANAALVERLGAAKAVLFDAAGGMPGSVAQELASVGVGEVTTLSARKAMVEAMLAEAGEPNIVLFGDQPQALGAAMAAARYRGVVLAVPEDVQKQSVAALAAIPDFMLEREKLERATKLDESFSEKNESVADTFYEWIAALGAEDPARLETVMTFAIGSKTSGVPLTLERSLSGDPTKPDQRGAVTSRFPGTPLENVAHVNRTTLYRGLVFSNKRPARVNMSMVAYEVQLPGGYYGPFRDNEGCDHYVNEFWGYEGEGRVDPGVYVTFRGAGYDVAFHNGRHGGDQPHAINEGEASYGFWKEIQDGCAFYYNSSHGGTNDISPMRTDAGVEEELAWGSENWPSVDGRVNRSGPNYTWSDFNADFSNLHSMVAVFNSCLVGGGKINPTLLNCGGAGSISSYISVSFDGSGWFWCLFVDKVCQPGTTLGAATAFALARTSEVFPSHTPGVDSSLRYVLFGDAKMELVKPDWTKPAPVAGEEAGAHRF